MKYIVTLIILLFGFFQIDSTFALKWLFDDKSKIIYCSDGECGLDKWTEMVKWGLKDIETQRSASTYIQDIVKYLLTFITLIAVLYIIYAWFQILTSAGDDDKVSKSKTTIITVLLGIVIIWLSYAIVNFIIWVVTK